MVALIAAVIVTAVTLIGTNLTSVFNKVANADLTTATRRTPGGPPPLRRARVVPTTDGRRPALRAAGTGHDRPGPGAGAGGTRQPPGKGASMKRRRRAASDSRDRGSVAVEFALLLPVLLLLIFGIIDFGRAINAQITLTQAAREGARLASLGYSDLRGDHPHGERGGSNIDVDLGEHHRDPRPHLPARPVPGRAWTRW